MGSLVRRGRPALARNGRTTVPIYPVGPGIDTRWPDPMTPRLVLPASPGVRDKLLHLPRLVAQPMDEAFERCRHFFQGAGDVPVVVSAQVAQRSCIGDRHIPADQQAVMGAGIVSGQVDLEPGEASGVAGEEGPIKDRLRKDRL